MDEVDKSARSNDASPNQQAAHRADRPSTSVLTYGQLADYPSLGLTRSRLPA